jgi:hypothetical protein
VFHHSILLRQFFKQELYKRRLIWMKLFVFS